MTCATVTSKLRMQNPNVYSKWCASTSYPQINSCNLNCLFKASFFLKTLSVKSFEFWQSPTECRCKYCGRALHFPNCFRPLGQNSQCGEANEGNNKPQNDDPKGAENEKVKSFNNFISKKTNQSASSVQCRNPLGVYSALKNKRKLQWETVQIAFWISVRQQS